MPSPGHAATSETRPIQEITAEDVIALRTAMLSEPTRTGRVASHRTIVYTLLAVRLVFEYGVRAGHLASNPADGVKAPRKSSIKTRTPAPATWTAEELRRFIGYLGEEPDVRDRHDPRHGAWVKPAFLLSACGLRRGEVLGLCWDAVDFEQGTVRVEASRTRTGGHHGETDRDDAKSGNSRRTLHPDDLHPGVMDALRDLREAQAKDRAENPACWDNPDGLVVVNVLGAGRRPGDLPDPVQAALPGSRRPRDRAAPDPAHPGQPHARPRGAPQTCRRPAGAQRGSAPGLATSPTPSPAPSRPAKRWDGPSGLRTCDHPAGTRHIAALSNTARPPEGDWVVTRGDRLLRLKVRGDP